MTNYEVTLQSAAPISFGAYFPNAPTGANKDQYEKDHWRERCNVNADGNVVITPFAVRNSLMSAAARMGMKTGNGRKTFTKPFETGIQVLDPIVLPYTRETVPGEWRMVPSDGKPAAFSKGARVPKCFPIIKSWEGKVIITVLDDTITKDALETHLQFAGQFIGLGSHRIENRGIYGRFMVVSVTKV